MFREENIKINSLIFFMLFPAQGGAQMQYQTLSDQLWE